MNVSDHLSKQQRDKLKSKKKEKVNWPEIMGMNRDTYKRGKGGALRRK